MPARLIRTCDDHRSDSQMQYQDLKKIAARYFKPAAIIDAQILELIQIQICLDYKLRLYSSL